MTLILANNKIIKILTLLIFSWLLYFLLSSELLPSQTGCLQADSSTIENAHYHQDFTRPASESNLTFCPVVSLQTPVKENSSSQFVASSCNSIATARFSQYIHILSTVVLKYRKSDLLFPAHYFW